MAWELKEGEKIESDSGETIEILSKIGGGGQGAVYKVLYKGDQYALKWYKLGTNAHKKEFIKNLDKLTKAGTVHDSFAWPIEITKKVNNTYGYVMPLIPKEYREFGEYLNLKTRFASVEARINAALQIVECFRVLHSKGYSYQDLNEGNFFVHPVTGNVLICDNENVAPYGETFGIRGKARYMAPEVAVSKKAPDVHTDRFSMAVILFMMLYMEHPLEGQLTNKTCMDDSLEREAFGSNPVFCMDKENNSNRPVEGVHKNILLLWDFYPDYIKELFQEAFSQERLVGKKAEQRVIELTWRKNLLRLRSDLYICDCGEEGFINKEGIEYCTNCGKEHNFHRFLESDEVTIPVYNGKSIYRSDLDDTCHEMYARIGQVIEKPEQKGVFGLRNLSDCSWKYIRSDGSEAEILPNRIVGLTVDNCIKIGKKQFKITDKR